MTTIHFDQLQLAERWGLSPKTLERWRVLGTGPKYIRLPGKVIYRLYDIEAYENECLVSSTAEYRKMETVHALRIGFATTNSRSRSIDQAHDNLVATGYVK
ncbi:MAG: hypothetical protein ACD_23C01073G0002 [uncultured bacterium]|nr:MAG: hypothetical protein ACD_23C01073G0002 [uncultured bacterium]